MKTQMLFVLTALVAISALPIDAKNSQKQTSHQYRELKESFNELGSTAGRLVRGITLSLMKTLVITATGATAGIIIAPILFKGNLNSKDIALAAGLGAGFFCFGKYYCYQFEKIMNENDQNTASNAKAKHA